MLSFLLAFSAPRSISLGDFFFKLKGTENKTKTKKNESNAANAKLVDNEDNNKTVLFFPFYTQSSLLADPRTTFPTGKRGTPSALIS